MKSFFTKFFLILSLSIFCFSSLFPNEEPTPENSQEANLFPEQSNSKAQNYFVDFSSPSSEEELKTIYDDGFYFIGKDDTLKIGGWAQLDYRSFLGNHSDGNFFKDTFFVRRARLDIRGTLEKDFAYRLYGAYEGSFAKLQEAWVEWKKFPQLRIRIGQFKEPYSLEALYSARWIHFVERGLGPTNLAPFEDLGVQVFGSLCNKRVVYAIAAFNGERKNREDEDNSKDVAMRLVVQPFRNCHSSCFENLYLGASGTFGRHDDSLRELRYRTAGRVPFVEFTADTIQKGCLSRGGAEFEWLLGPFEMSGEYLILHRNGVQNTTEIGELTSHAWYVALGYLLTMEDQVKNSPIRPWHNFNPCKRCGWGAWELCLRYEEFKTNESAFTKKFVIGAEDARAITGGVIWWPNVHVKFMLNYVYTNFNKDILVSNKLISNENLLLFRAQYVF